jgi:anaphase-promoting complex subunit 3
MEGFVFQPAALTTHFFLLFSHRCVVGNCLSLQREGEGAIRAFQRALQLRPHLAYAATLVGLEHCALEDLGAGLIAFQAALRADSRDYRAL